MNSAAVKIFTQPSLASSLLTAFAQNYGVRPLAGTDDERWDPRTIGLELAQDAGGILPENLDKLLTAAEVLTSNSFERSVSDFIRICNTLSDSPTDGGFDPAETHEMAWAVLEVGIIRGAQAADYNPEITGYVAHMLEQDGFIQVPDSLASILPDRNLPNAGLASTEDPEMYAMTSDLQGGREEEVTAFVVTRYQKLLEEVSSLAGGENQNWAANLLQELQGAA